MTETLTIRNFGPIKDVFIDLRIINILIGDQGTGKSTVAKVLASIKVLLNETFLIDDESHSFNINGKPASELEFRKKWREDFDKWLSYYDISSYLYSNSYIEFNDSAFHFQYASGEIIIKSLKKNRNQDKKTPVDCFIPANREGILLLKNDLFGLIKLGTPLPDTFTIFGQLFNTAQYSQKVFDYSDILGISVGIVQGELNIFLQDGKKILIDHASSAIKSGVPMLIVFDYKVHDRTITISESPKTLVFYPYCPYVIIEEPELNCFPTTQDKLMRYFISKIKIPDVSQYGYYNRLIITTHSPYILTSLNNLMYGYVTGQQNYKEADEIIPSKYWINPDDVSAYMLLTDGTCENIMDREEHLILADKIDAVSSILNEQFDKLLTIEYSSKK